MPVPGSLKRRPIDEKSIAETLSSQFKVPNEEVVAYLKLLDTSDLTLQQLSEKLAIDEVRASTLVSSMLSRGLIIEASGTSKRFAPLHPRMMLTNLFKILEKELVQTLRDRRATVDRVVNLLIPVYEERETLEVASRKT
ncbi:MAG TPA: helix-turn-helix domain-containing protein [Candidatus Bathyarchaeia archaeon]|nr:helix-turn-helix domain-containing protein [Candidatus Bathyarchaeia archaeon]